MTPPAAEPVATPETAPEAPKPEEESEQAA